jgi:hypothetical protein
MSTPAAWRERGACVGKPAAWWFSSGKVDTEHARSICFSCRVRSDCLWSQLSWEEELRQTFPGMFGGRTEKERKVLLRLRGSEALA